VQVQAAGVSHLHIVIVHAAANQLIDVGIRECGIQFLFVQIERQHTFFGEMQQRFDLRKQLIQQQKYVDFRTLGALQPKNWPLSPKIAS
jgi:hypothetical protein